jgi:rubrerythrin
VLRLFPRYERDDLLVRLFERAVRDQWSAAEVDWEAPLGLRPRQAEALARILSPVYLGEQSAMFGAASVLPQLAAAGETPAQLYLSTFILDEARHFDILTDLYRRLGHHPVSLRELPEMLRYHHRLRQGDRLDWAWGILISDLFARQFYQAFAKVQPQALFGKLSAHILLDESRHQAFAHTYLKRALPHLPPERRRAFRQRQDELLAIMAAMHQRLRDDAEALGLDGRAFLEELQAQVEAHARSIGLADPQDEDEGGSGPGPWSRLIAAKRQAADGVHWPDDRAESPRRWFAMGLRHLAEACAGCAVALLCRSRAVAAAARS